MSVGVRSVGAGIDRIEAREKVTGEARYAYEHRLPNFVYGTVLQATIGKGEVLSVDAESALALPGVLGVLWHEDAPRLHQVSDAELEILQGPRVAYHGQIIGAVIADRYETARQAERLVRIEYRQEPHDVLLSTDHSSLYQPEKVNPTYPGTTDQGDFEAAYAQAEVSIDCTYETPAEHNNPMEPHASIAVWEEDSITVYDSTQGASSVRDILAKAFGMEPGRVRVISPHVGGGFGAKGTPRPHVILAVMASQVVRRPVKLAVTRQQMFDFTGYRTPTIQRLRLGSDREGRLTAISHEVYEQSSTIREFAEQTATPTRMMYAGANRRTSHHLARLDLPTPSWMRAPGETPGMFALESAMDELAIAAGIDPVELRIRNEPEVDPGSGNRWSSRSLVDCLREGAERFNWRPRHGRHGHERGPVEGHWLTGTGVAASVYPARRRPSEAKARLDPDGGYVVELAAADIGTGARTALTQLAAETLEVSPGEVTVNLGDSALPSAPLAGGSMGTASWGSAVVKACRELRAVLARGDTIALPLEVQVDTSEDVAADAPLARYAFGAQFVEVAVNSDTGEVHVPRAMGVFAAGRIVNAKTARSQFLGGMVMGIGMALHEESRLDLEFGDYANHDLATYHVPVCADIEDLEVAWIEENDEHVNPIGVKGIGEIGIVGTAAAVANAVHHATGVRIRSLPIGPARLVGRV